MFSGGLERDQCHEMRYIENNGKQHWVKMG